MSEMSGERPASFLGTGWSFPPEFVVESSGAGQVRMTSDEDDIQASLSILLSTASGERFLSPKYGLDLRDQIFESISTTARTYLLDRVRDAILIYEPRIEIVALALDSSREFEGLVQLRVEYSVRTTNSRYNLVFPFYRSDASELKGRTPLAAPAA